MDDLKRQVLRNLTVELTDNMNPNALVPYLYQKRLLTRDEFERVSLPTMTRLDKNLHILQKIPTKGPRAFDLFVECLTESGEEPHLQLADNLTRQLHEARRKWHKRYIAQAYYLDRGTKTCAYQRDVHVPIIWDLELYRKIVREKYSVNRDKNEERQTVGKDISAIEEGPRIIIDINSDKLSLKACEPQSGWKIVPLTTTLLRSSIDSYNAGTEIPAFQYEVSWEGDGSPKCLHQNFYFEGTRLENSYMTVILRPPMPSTGIDKDGRRVKELLKPLNKDELKELFAELGLYEATLRNKYSDSRAAYLDDLIGLWILRRNAVSERGGATWGSLKKALQILDHNQISANIPVSTAGDDPSSHKIKVLTISETDSSHIKMKTATASLEGDVDVPILSGADIVAEMKLDITPGKPLTYDWEGHGFKIHIPADAISDDNGPVTLSIQASLSGKYQLPDDDHVFVSGVYWLALHPHVKFTKEVTVTIQHCGSNDADSTPLSFVKAKTQSTLPCIFKPLPGGSFSDSQKNGVIKIDHFCGIAVSGKQNSFYALCTYYLHKQLNVYETHITVTPDLELQLKVVRDTYKKKERSEEGPSEVAKINSHEISLTVQDPAGVGIPRRMWEKDGWEMDPLKKATLEKEYLDHYEPGRVIPHFEISLKCVDENKSLSQMVTFTGVESETFITISRHPAVSEKGELGISQTVTTANTEPLDIDKDGRKVKELLEPLENYQLKHLFEELGLSNATLTNRYRDSRDAYLDDLVHAWIQGRDYVLDRGGATWESLKRALQELGHNGIVVNITPSTADSSSITRRSMREDGSDQSTDQSLQLTTRNTQLMTQDEPHSVQLRIKEQPSSSHNQNDEGVVQTNTHHDSLQQQKGKQNESQSVRLRIKEQPPSSHDPSDEGVVQTNTHHNSPQQQQDIRWFLVMIIMLFMLLVGTIGYYVFFRES